MSLRQSGRAGIFVKLRIMPTDDTMPTDDMMLDRWHDADRLHDADRWHDADKYSMMLTDGMMSTNIA